MACSNWVTESLTKALFAKAKMETETHRYCQFLELAATEPLPHCTRRGKWIAPASEWPQLQARLLAGDTDIKRQPDQVIWQEKSQRGKEPKQILTSLFSNSLTFSWSFFAIPTGSWGALKIIDTVYMSQPLRAQSRTEEGKTYVWSGKCQVSRTGVLSDYDRLSTKCILIYYLNKPVPCKTMSPLKMVTYATITRFWKQLQKANSENALYHACDPFYHMALFFNLTQ